LASNAATLYYEEVIKMSGSSANERQAQFVSWDGV